MTSHHKKLLQRVRADFESNTADHEITVLLDRSLDPEGPAPYRHLRIAEPGTLIYSWDIITWPGHLATVGDIADGYTFSRVHDMAQFFAPEPEPHRINPSYWAEKLAHAQRSSTKSFSLEALIEAMDDDIEQSAQEYGVLSEWRPEWVDALAEAARTHVREAVEFGGSSSDEDAAYSALRSFEYTGNSLFLDLGPQGRPERSLQVRPFSFDRNGEAYELMSSAYEYDYHLLLAMHAIVRGLEMYRAQLEHQHSFTSQTTTTHDRRKAVTVHTCACGAVRKQSTEDIVTGGRP